MANKTHVEYYDDLSGKLIEADDVHTVEWTWSGADYSIDLSTNSLERIEAGKVPVSALLKKSSRIGGRRKSATTKRTAKNAPTSKAANSSSPAGELAAVRQWAKDQGYSISDRGRISREITEAYRNSH